MCTDLHYKHQCMLDFQLDESGGTAQSIRAPNIICYVDIQNPHWAYRERHLTLSFQLAAVVQLSK